MNDIDLFLELPIRAQVAVACLIACGTGLFAILLIAPQQNCFFLRWRPVTRFMALMVAPALLILWPIVLYGWFLKSPGNRSG